MPLAVAIAIAVVALVALALFAAWLLGFEPLRRLSPLRESASEAGERTMDTAGELWDWLRTGR